MTQDAQLDRIWNKLDRSYERYEQRSQTTRRLLPVAGALALAAAMGFGVWRFAASPAPLAQEALTQSDGSRVPSANVFEGGRAITFSDGSHLEGSTGATLAVLRNAPTRFHTRLEEGRVLFDVKPSAGDRSRTWTIQNGPLEVQVVGTRFVVSRDSSLLGVEVERGKVRVSGEGVAGGSRLLSAGESLSLPTEASTPPAPVQPALPQTAGADTDLPPEQDTSPSDALSRSDALRRQGRPEAAAALLRAALAESPRPRQAALLAFSLGRLQLDLLQQPRPAARSFQMARHAGLPATLREQALAREVHAWAAAGAHQQAKAAARSYLGQYPQGPNRELVLRWLGRTDTR